MLIGGSIIMRCAQPTWPTGLGISLLLLVALSACTTVLTRNPVPEDKVFGAAPYGIRVEGLRLRGWGDHLELSEAELDASIRGFAKRLKHARADEIAAGEPLTENILALSGGGPDGAYGAGYMNGWTARGDRPKFDFVTGISTGSIIGVFAFLGPDYDDKLKEAYTTYKTSDLFETTYFAALTGGTAITDARGYRRLIERYIDDEVVERLGQAFLEGRNLFIGTTNIDAARPVIWNIGAIAVSGHPKAKVLIQDIIQASSAIPAAFPPVIIPVETEDGKMHDEMHVDGGATQQVMLFSANVPLKRIDEAVGLPIDRAIYIIINNKLVKPYDPVRPRLVAIAGAAGSSLIGGSGTGDIYKIYTLAERDDIALNLLWIPEDFAVESQEPFDPVYMKALYDLGYQHGLAGDQWLHEPPGYARWPE